MKEKSKERILKAALKLFAKKGYDGTGIREICKKANANLCMIPHFWGTKQALYQNILEELIDKQTEYAKKIINLDKDPKGLSKKEQIDLLYKAVDNIAEFIYGGNLSSDYVRFLLTEQHDQKTKLVSPVLIYFRKLIGAIFGKSPDDSDIIYKSLFIIAQINSAKIMPSFSLLLLNKKDFDNDDKEKIKANAKVYVKTLLEQEGIND